MKDRTYAAARGREGDVGPLHLLPSTPEYPELLKATESGALRQVAALLALGVPVDPPPSTKGLPAPGTTALHVAARCGHSTLVRLLLRRGADKTRLEPFGATPIHLAALEGHTRCVAILLSHGVSVDQVDREGRTPLQEAVQGGYLDTARLLLAAGANPNETDSLGRSALAKVYDKLDGQHPAAAPMRALLLAAGAADRKDGALGDEPTVLCMTPLHAAVSAGARSTASHLLREDPASVHVEHFRADTALHMAALRGDAEMTQLLLAAGAKPNAHTRRGKESGNRNDATPLLCAINSNDLTTVRAVLTALPDPTAQHLDPQALHRAARQPDGMAVLELLLDIGADPRIQVHEETARDVAATPAMRERLRRAMLAGNPVPQHRALANATALAKLIAAEGPSSPRLPSGGDRPLHAAANARATEIIELLLNAGAELLDYKTPPSWSAPTVTSLGRSSRPRRSAWNSSLARDIAEGVSGGMRSLDWRNVTDEEAEAWCNENPHHANEHYPDALTPLHMAASFDKPRAVAALLRHGACLERRTHLGETPLMFAARRAGAETVSVLLDAGADLRAEHGHQSALHEACAAGNTAAARVLIEAGADVNATTRWSRG